LALDKVKAKVKAKAKVVDHQPQNDRLFFQSSKVLVKKELAYVPVIGWMWYFLEIVFCKRKWEEDRITMAQSLQKLHDYPENFWVRRRRRHFYNRRKISTQSETSSHRM